MKTLVTQISTTEHFRDGNKSYILNEYSDGTWEAEFSGDTLGPFDSRDAAEIAVAEKADE